MNLEHFYVVWTKKVESGSIQCFIESFISENKNINKQMLSNIFSNLLGREILFDNEKIGVFNSSDEIKKFSFCLAQELNLKSISLVSLEELNLALEKQLTKESFLKDLQSLGDSISNPDFNKPSLFDKFF